MTTKDGVAVQEDWDLILGDEELTDDDATLVDAQVNEFKKKEILLALERTFSGKSYYFTDLPNWTAIDEATLHGRILNKLRCFPFEKMSAEVRVLLYRSVMKWIQECAEKDGYSFDNQDFQIPDVLLDTGRRKRSTISVEYATGRSIQVPFWVALLSLLLAILILLFSLFSWPDHESQNVIRPISKIGTPSEMVTPAQRELPQQFSDQELRPSPRIAVRVPNRPLKNRAIKSAWRLFFSKNAA